MKFFRTNSITLFRFFLIMAVTIAGLNSWSVPQSFLQREHYVVTVNSQTQVLIDEAVEAAFNSPMRNDFCKVYGNHISLTYAAGVSLEKSQKIMQSCPAETRHALLAKAVPKKYFLIFDDRPHPEIESWTTEMNATYIWIHPKMSLEEFKTVITHEMAMAVDAKMGIGIMGYYKFQKMHQSKLPDGRIQITKPSAPSPIEEVMRKAFNGSFFPPIAYSFALMRAYEIEKLVRGEISFHQVPSHRACTEQFNLLFQKIINHPKEFRYDPTSIQGDLIRAIQGHISEELLEETLLTIGDPNLILPNSGHLTFCQYMADPLLSGRSFDTFFSQGPRRPRTGSGWRPGAGEPGAIDGNDETSKYLQPGSGESRFQTKTIESHILIQEIKQDLLQNRLKKIEKNQFR